MTLKGASNGFDKMQVMILKDVSDFDDDSSEGDSIGLLNHPPFLY